MEVTSIAEQILFSTFRIDTIMENSRKGVATGFVFDYNIEEKNYLFLVTNKHVVTDAKIGKINFLMNKNGKPQLGQSYPITIAGFEKIWHDHPDQDIDVTVSPFGPLLKKLGESGVNIFYKSIPRNLVPSKDDLMSLDSIEDVVFIGYPSGIWDSTNFLPITRKGITATPICIDFKGKPQFVIDASVFEGSSGSPVFLYNTGMYTIKGKGATVGSRLLFLGIIAGVFFKNEENDIRIRHVPTSVEPFVVSRQMLDLGIVFKASTITDAIEDCLKEHKIL